MVVLILLVRDMLSSGSPRTRFFTLAAYILSAEFRENDGFICLFCISNFIFIAVVTIDGIVDYF